jgi:hypothetical protein
MRSDHAACLLDRTPVLFGTRGHFPHIGDDTVCIGTIGAVQLLHRIQVSEALAIEHQIVPAPDLRDAVHPETNGLVKRHPKVQDHKGHDQGIDHRRRHHDPEPCAQQVGYQGLAQLMVPADHFLIEQDTAAFHPITEARPLLGKLGFKFKLKLMNLAKYTVRVIRHAFPMLPVSGVGSGPDRSRPPE